MDDAFKDKVRVEVDLGMGMSAYGVILIEYERGYDIRFFDGTRYLAKKHDCVIINEKDLFKAKLADKMDKIRGLP